MEERECSAVRCRWIVGALVLAVLLNNYAWIQASDIRINFDLPVHGRMVLQQYAALLSGDLYQFLVFPFDKHGPLCYDLAACLLLVTGVHLETVLLSSSLWIPLYVLAIYGIGRRLFDEKTACLACMFFLSIPLFADHVKQFPLEIGAHALVMTVLWLFIESDMLRRRGLAIACGAAFGLSLLTKTEITAIWALPCLLVFYSFGLQCFRSPVLRVLFLLVSTGAGALLCRFVATHQPAWRDRLLFTDGACLALVAQGLALVICWLLVLRVLEMGGWWQRLAIAVQRLAHLVASVLVAAIVSGPFLLTRDLTSMAQERLYSAANGFATNSCWVDPTWYPRAMLARSFHQGYVLLLVVGTVAFFALGYHRDAGKRIVMGMLVYVLAILAAIPGRFEYYLLNILGPASLVATCWIVRFRAARAVVILLTSWTAIQIFGWTILPRVPLQPSRYVQTFDDPRLYSRLVTWTFLPMFPQPPITNGYRIDDILSDVARDSRGESILLVPPTPYRFAAYHPESFRLFASYRQLSVCVPRDVDELDADPGLPLNSHFGNPLEPDLGATILRRREPVYFVLQGDHPRHRSDDIVRGYLKHLFPHFPPGWIRYMRSYEDDICRLQLFRASRTPHARK